MVLGEIAYIPPLLSCLSVCVWWSPKMKPSRLVWISSATILETLFAVSVDSASEKINLKECLFWLEFILWYWSRDYRPIASCLCAPFIMWIGHWWICKALMTSIWQQWQPKGSWRMWGPLRVPIMLRQNAIFCCVDAGGFCTYSRFINSCRDNSQSWNVLLLKEETLSNLSSPADMLIIRFPSVFNLMSFSCTAIYSRTSQFFKKSLKGATKSSLRQPSHSWMQAWGLAPSN